MNTSISEIRENPITETCSALAACEAIIERGLKSFVEVGTALLRIRDEKLYRAEYRTFEEYCQKRWKNINRPRAYQLMVAVTIVVNLSTLVDIPAPTSERQVRPLTPLPAPQQREAWGTTVREYGPTPTAREVETVVKRDFVKGDAPRKPVRPAGKDRQKGFFAIMGHVSALDQYSDIDIQSLAAALDPDSRQAFATRSAKAIPQLRRFARILREDVRPS